MNHTVEIDLLRNSTDFVDEALTNAAEAESSPIRWKFAILHLVLSIELSLKEALRREHEWLIFRNVDKRTLTVGLEEAVERLTSLKRVMLSKDDIAALRLAVEKRNTIVHHNVTISPTVLKPAFAKLLGLLSDIYGNLLATSLQAEVNPDKWRQALRIRDYAEEIQKRSIPRYAVDIHVMDCPECGWRTLALNGDCQGECGVCLIKEDFILCDRCECAIIRGTEEHEAGHVYCRSCLEYVSNDYWHDAARE
jgi:hypothetical protein